MGSRIFPVGDQLALFVEIYDNAGGSSHKIDIAATVTSDGPAVLFTLRRDNFERMRRERPDLASAFDDFIMRILADRIDVANREVAALEPLTASMPTSSTLGLAGSSARR